MLTASTINCGSFGTMTLISSAVIGGSPDMCVELVSKAETKNILLYLKLVRPDNITMCTRYEH